MDVFYWSKTTITIRFLTLAIVCLCYIPWTPCSSRPIFSTVEPAGIHEKSHNTSMVVRIIVSSSSSSSGDDFSHLLTPANNATRSSEKSILLPSSASAPTRNLRLEQSVSTSTATPILLPTTYRPKLRIHVPISPYSLRHRQLSISTAPPTSTTSTTTTIKPLPFQEDIFSVFYRAFCQNHSPPSASKSVPSSSSPPVELASSSKNVESFEIFPNPRTVEFRSPFRPQYQSSGRRIFYTIPPKNESLDFESMKEKTVTTVVTRSSSVSAKLPTITAHYPRIRPSSYMMLSLKAVTTTTKPEEMLSTAATTNKLDLNAENSSTVATTAEADKEKIQPYDPDWSNKDPVGADNAEPRGDGKKLLNDEDNDDDLFPKAEALVQDKTDLNSVGVNEGLSTGDDDQNGAKDDILLVTRVVSQPENWSEPAKVWSTPAKVWGEPAKVWGEPSKVWSEPPTTYSPLTSTDANLTMPESNAEDEAAAPQGTFYELGEDEEETPTGIPSELTRKSEDLPELSPALDHSFLDPSSRAVEVAESIQVSLKHQMDYHVDSKAPQSEFHNRSQSQKLLQQREKSAKKFGYILDGSDVRKYRVEERTPDGYIVGEYGVLSDQHGFVRGVRYTADGTINPRLIHEALMKFLSL